jgi:hypothetical protein
LFPLEFGGVPKSLFCELQLALLGSDCFGQTNSRIETVCEHENEERA